MRAFLCKHIYCSSQGGIFNGQAEGFGIYTHMTATTHECRFKGYFLGLKRCGAETRNNTISFRGMFFEDKYCGLGIRYYPDGNRYDGNWLNGKRSGQGIYYYANGDRLDGSWLHGKQTGQGIHHYASSGSRYESTWLDGKRTGQGMHHYASGSSVERNYLHVDSV